MRAVAARRIQCVNVSLALAVSHRGYLPESVRIVLVGTGTEMLDSPKMRGYISAPRCAIIVTADAGDTRVNSPANFGDIVFAR